MTEQTPSEGPKPSSMLTTPMAIVVAGALIAVAVYFAGGGGAKTTTPTAPGAAPQVPGAPAAQPTPGDPREVTSEDNIRGASDAKITIIEYSDLECPFCQRFHVTMKQVLEAYPNDVRWVYRHAPLVQLHSKAPAEANAAECAGEQGRFWEFVDLVFETGPMNDGLNLATLPDLARQAGVANISQFESCVESDKYKEVVDADLQDAYTAGLRGTPYSLIISPDGELTPINGAQPFESVKSTIDSLL